MFTSGLLSLFAAGTALASAAVPADLVTRTSTTTHTIIMTQCDPVVTDCPLKMSSAPVFVATSHSAAQNSSTSLAPSFPSTSSVECSSTSSKVSSAVYSPSVVVKPVSSSTVAHTPTHWQVLNSTITGPTATAPPSLVTVQPPVTLVTVRPPMSTSVEIVNASVTAPSALPTGAASGVRVGGGIVVVALVAALAAIC